MKVLLQIVTNWPDPISSGVRLVTHGWASHAEFVLPDGSTFGARCTGVKKRPYEPNRHKTVQRFAAPEIDKAYEWALTQDGKSYDFFAIAGILFNRNWRDPSRWFCSELIAASFEQVEAPLLDPDVKVNMITPRDLLLSMQKWAANF